MGKVVSTKHTITAYNAFGANCVVNDQIGQFVIYATLTGSYGEKIHRIVGGSYWNIEKCLKKALKYHEGGEYRNVEIQDICTGTRTAMRDIVAMQYMLDNKH